MIRKVLAWLNAKHNLVATGDENDYYAWADERLDHLDMHANLLRRGYAYHCDRPDCGA